MKRVVIVQNTTLAENYGLSSYLRNIVRALSSHEDLQIFLICSAGKLNKATCPGNVTMFELPGSTYSVKGNALFFFKVLSLLKEINLEMPIDVIHCLYPNSSLAAAATFKMMQPKASRPTVIYDLRSPWIHIAVERGSIPAFLATPFRKIAYGSEKLLSYFVDKFIFITKGLQSYYLHHLHTQDKPLQIIPSGIDVDSFKNQREHKMDRAKYGLMGDDIVIGYVGVLSKFRELDFILRALKETQSVSLKLMFVGDGDATLSLKRTTHELNLTDRVIFTGRVPYNQISAIMQNFDVGICHLPDSFVFRQSYPMKVLEYLASGIPVLASDIQAHREISEHFSKVKLYTDEASLVRLMKTLEPTNTRETPPNINEYDWKAIAATISQAY